MAKKSYSGYVEKNYYDNTKYNGGIAATTDNLNEGYFRELVNFDIADTGSSLKPRRGFIQTTLHASNKILEDAEIFESSLNESVINLTHSVDISDYKYKLINEITSKVVKYDFKSPYDYEPLYTKPYDETNPDDIIDDIILEVNFNTIPEGTKGTLDVINISNTDDIDKRFTLDYNDVLGISYKSATIHLEDSKTLDSWCSERRNSDVTFNSGDRFSVREIELIQLDDASRHKLSYIQSLLDDLIHIAKTRTFVNDDRYSDDNYFCYWLWKVDEDNKAIVLESIPDYGTDMLLQSMSVDDIMNMWNTCEYCRTSLSKGNNGIALQFNPDETNANSIFNINKYKNQLIDKIIIKQYDDARKNIKYISNNNHYHTKSLSNISDIKLFDIIMPHTYTSTIISDIEIEDGYLYTYSENKNLSTFTYDLKRYENTQYKSDTMGFSKYHYKIVDNNIEFAGWGTNHTEKFYYDECDITNLLPIGTYTFSVTQNNITNALDLLMDGITSHIYKYNLNLDNYYDYNCGTVYYPNEDYKYTPDILPIYKAYIQNVPIETIPDEGQQQYHFISDYIEIVEITNGKYTNTHLPSGNSTDEYTYSEVELPEHIKRLELGHVIKILDLKNYKSLEYIDGKINTLRLNNLQSLNYVSQYTFETLQIVDCPKLRFNKLIFSEGFEQTELPNLSVDAISSLKSLEFKLWDKQRLSKQDDWYNNFKGEVIISYYDESTITNLDSIFNDEIIITPYSTVTINVTNLNNIYIDGYYNLMSDDSIKDKIISVRTSNDIRLKLFTVSPTFVLPLTITDESKGYTFTIDNSYLIIPTDKISNNLKLNGNAVDIRLANKRVSLSTDTIINPYKTQTLFIDLNNITSNNILLPAGFSVDGLDESLVYSQNTDDNALSHSTLLEDNTEVYSEHLISVNSIVNKINSDQLVEYIKSNYDKDMSDYNLIFDNLKLYNSKIAHQYIDESGTKIGLIPLLYENGSIRKIILTKLRYSEQPQDIYNGSTYISNTLTLEPIDTERQFSFYEANLSSERDIIIPDTDLQVISTEDEVNHSSTYFIQQFPFMYAKSNTFNKHLIDNSTDLDIEFKPYFALINTLKILDDQNILVNESNDKLHVSIKQSFGNDLLYSYDIYNTSETATTSISSEQEVKGAIYRSPIFALTDTSDEYEQNENILKKLEDVIDVGDLYIGTIDVDNISSIFNFDTDSGILTCNFKDALYKDSKLRELDAKGFFNNGILIVFHIIQAPVTAYLKTEKAINNYIDNPDTETDNIDTTDSNPYKNLVTYDSMIATSTNFTQTRFISKTYNITDITFMESLVSDKSHQSNFHNMNGMLVFNDISSGDRIVFWKDNNVYMSEAANGSDTEGFFKLTNYWQYNEVIVKVIQYRDMLLVFTVQNVYAIYPYTYTTDVQTQEEDKDGNLVTKTTKQETVSYASLPVLYNIMCDRKYADAIQVYNNMILFYSSDGQMFLIKPTATVDNNTRFTLQYFNKNANDILANYDKYIIDRLNHYDIHIDKPIFKDDIIIKVSTTINAIKIYYCVPDVITYILIYDVIAGTWRSYDTTCFTKITDIMFIPSGELLLTEQDGLTYLSMQYTDKFIQDSNCDMSICNDFEKQDINCLIDTGNLMINPHLKKRFRTFSCTYKNINASSLKYNLETFVDDLFINTFSEQTMSIKDVNGLLSYDYSNTITNVELLEDQSVLFNISDFTSNKILTHTTNIVSVGKNIRFKLHLSSKGIYKLISYGIIYKERTV